MSLAEDAAQAALGQHAILQFPATVTADIFQAPGGGRSTTLHIMPRVDHAGLMVTKRGLNMVARAPPPPVSRPHVLRMEDIPEAAVKRAMLKREEPPPQLNLRTSLQREDEPAPSSWVRPMLQRSLEVNGRGEVKRMLRKS